MLLLFVDLSVGDLVDASLFLGVFVGIIYSLRVGSINSHRHRWVHTSAKQTHKNEKQMWIYYREFVYTIVGPYQ